MTNTINQFVKCSRKGYMLLIEVLKVRNIVEKQSMIINVS